MTRPVDPRAWLLWMLAASLPVLVGRNPFVLVATLLAVLGVRAAWATTPRFASWRIVVRLAVIFAAVSVLFNLLTVHVGDWVLFRLPEQLPIIGGPLTGNALIYGVLSGLALLTLVLIGTTIGAALDWMTLLRLLPPRLTTMAVAGSVAWALIPQTISAFTEIWEAQLARGHRPRGPRDVVPLLVPLLSGSLERALMLAEALEARGFGAQPPAAESVRLATGLLTTFGLTAGATGAYLVAVGEPIWSISLLLAAGVAFVLATRSPAGTSPRIRRTRYREPVWGRPEWVIALASSLALAIAIAVLAVDPTAFAYDPYPALTAPPVNLLLLASLGLLLAPAAVSS